MNGDEAAREQADYVPQPSLKEAVAVTTPTGCTGVATAEDHAKYPGGRIPRPERTGPREIMAASACCEGLPAELYLSDEKYHLPNANDTSVSHNPKDIAAASKCPLHLIPPIAEGEIAWVLHDGAAKYGRANWRSEKISLCNYLGAMKRHINRILDGEDSDCESGLLHLAHIAATACIVMDAMEHDCVIDDRPGK